MPKIEPGLIEDDKLTASALVNVSVKRELEDEFANDELECKSVIKAASNTSGDYDEWLEIQKELGVYPSTTDTLRCKNTTNSGSNNSCGITKSSKIERTRANGEYRANIAGASVSDISNTFIKDSCEQDIPSFERRWSSATDLERDLLEDTDSLDGLALQTQCPSSLHVSNESGTASEHDLNAQVQSAIDSILKLKKLPANTLSSSSSSASQSSDSKDTALDQAVRSILGS